jgi:hypothetical protein
VTELRIGLERIGAVGGSGVVYFDDIRLYPYSRQLVTPAEPDQANLVARYEFEGNINDSSGNAHQGTAIGDPIFVAGKTGQAIKLNGFDDYVEITGYKGVLGTNPFSITAWIKTTDDQGDIVGWGNPVRQEGVMFRINDNRLRCEHGAGNLQGDTNVNDNAWHHVAVTVKENATISHPEVILWVDGIDNTRPGTSPNTFNLTANYDVAIGRRYDRDERWLSSLVDDVRIYYRALTPEEIAWLAGRTKPFDKPF